MSPIPRDIKHIQDIYKLARGGVAEIAYKLKKHPRTVERWVECGIPDTYWPRLYDLYGVLPIECFKLNAKIRGYRDHTGI